MYCPTCHHANRTGSIHCEECLTSLRDGVDEPWRTERTTLADAVGTVARRDGPKVVESASLREAVDAMSSAGTGCVLVVDPEGQLTGVFSERDVLNKVVDRGLDLAAEPVWRYMTHGPDTVPADAPLAKALQHMLIGGFRHLPLVDADGRPTGIVSSRDIVDHVADRL